MNYLEKLINKEIKLYDIPKHLKTKAFFNRVLLKNPIIIEFLDLIGE